jgi:ribosomal-protein-serine acetyltransferase
MTFENYIIRPLETKDAAALHEMMQRNKERFIDYFRVSVGSTETVSATRNYIIQKNQEAKNKEAFAFAITVKNSPGIAGMLFIKTIDWRIPKAELAYFIDKEFEGKGLTTKALNLIVDHAFTVLKINKLFLRAAKDNIASQRVALKNGFVLEGVLRNDFKINDESLIDTLYYGLIKKL